MRVLVGFPLQTLHFTILKLHFNDIVGMYGIQKAIIQNYQWPGFYVVSFNEEIFSVNNNKYVAFKIS